MTHRERVLTALRHKAPDRVPMFLNLSPGLRTALAEATGTSDLLGYFELDYGPELWTHRKPSTQSTDFRRFFSAVPESATYSEWGEMSFPSGFHHFRGYKPPMAGFTSIVQLETYPFPDLGAEWRYSACADHVAEVHARGYPSASAYECGIFEQAHGLRGMENLLVDLKLNPEFARSLLDQITDRKISSAVNYAKTGVDILFLGDDFGFEHSLIMSVETWCDYFKPLWAKCIAAVRAVRPDVIIAFHSCGHVEPLVPELIECGIDVLESVQAEANDAARLKRLYGDELAFWGTIGVQSTFPFGTPAQVSEVVLERIRTIGQGGGLMIGPSHVIEPETPVENVLAFVEAVRKHGWY